MRISSVAFTAALASGCLLIGIGVARPNRMEAASWSEVQPILKARCGMCHGADSPAAGLNLESFAGVMKGGASGPAVKAGQAKASLLIRRVEGVQKPQMPMGGDPLPAAERAKIAAWIDAGALEAAGIVGPATTVETPSRLPKPGEPVLYRHVAPIFGKRCAMCHVDGGQMGSAPERLRLDTYANAVGSGERANLIPGSPETSLIYRTVKGLDDKRMPMGGAALSADEIRVFGDWIRQGARDDSGKKSAIPAGKRIRLEGILTGRWAIDGASFDTGGARIDKSPQVGQRVRLEGIVTAEGRVRAERVRPR